MKKLFILSVLTLSTTIFSHAAKSKSAGLKTEKDIVFATHQGARKGSTSLDVYSPVKGKDHPVMIFVHGGAWVIGNKHRVELKPAAFVEKGYVFVSVNYRLHPQGTWKQQATDVAAAIGWVKMNIKKHGGSAENINIMGHSAGAHLAALVATDETYLKAENMKLSNLQSVILLDGAGYDIPLQIKTTDIRWFKNLMKKVFSTDEKVQQSASPISHIESKKGIPPFLILYVANRENSKKLSESFGKKLVEADVSAKVIGCQNKTHRTINIEIGKKNDKPTTEIFQFLNSIDQ